MSHWHKQMNILVSKKLPKISEEQRQIINGPIRELVEAIKNGKATGPDGLSGLYYCICCICFEDVFLQPLQSSMNSIFIGGKDAQDLEIG